MFRQLWRNAEERVRLFLSERERRAQIRINPSSRFVPGFRFGYGEREARGLQLLKEWLTPEQIAQYDAKSYFEVTGCHSGKRYRISHGTSMNVRELDGAGRPRVGWCFVPKGHLVAGDVMLAQKVALETDERGALTVANKFFFVSRLLILEEATARFPVLFGLATASRRPDRIHDAAAADGGLGQAGKLLFNSTH